MATTLSATDTASSALPPFEPHRWLRDPHIQTILGRYLPGPRLPLPTVYVEIDVPDGDRLSLLDSRPDSWRPGDPAAVMVHGLGGCARSPYVSRVAAKLVARGVRVIRMNLRGAGSGFGAARKFYHSGKTEDVRAAAGWIAARAAGSPIALIGYSLGANLVLKLAGEAASEPLAGLDCVLASNPPIDLEACCRAIQSPRNRIYDRNFVRQLKFEVGRLRLVFPELAAVPLDHVQTLLDFDEAFTAPLNSFRDARDYYTRCSARWFLPKIEVPGLVIHAEDDPFIPATPFREVEFPRSVALELIPHGGHLGFLHREDVHGDRRWLDARIVSWLSGRWALPAPARPPAVAPNRSPSRTRD